MGNMVTSSNDQAKKTIKIPSSTPMIIITIKIFLSLAREKAKMSFGSRENVVWGGAPSYS